MSLPRPRARRHRRPALRSAALRTVLAALLPLLLAGPAAADAVPVGEPLVGEVPVGVWPLRPEPAVAQRFAPPLTPYAAGHRGVDLVAVPGQTVRAGLAGTVSFAGSVAGRGVVVVDHGRTRTTYEPVTASVDVGRSVTAGEPLGVVRAGPASHCFPRTCLHWGWIDGETYLDPLLLVGAGPVRLLPLGGPVGAPVGAPVGVAAGSGAGVRLLIGPAEPVGGDVGVALGGGQ